MNLNIGEEFSSREREGYIPYKARKILQGVQRRGGKRWMGQGVGEAVDLENKKARKAGVWSRMGQAQLLCPLLVLVSNTQQRGGLLAPG